jgi:putative NIF3 family GTP cyclohydrolase 1 type 2
MLFDLKSLSQPPPSSEATPLAECLIQTLAEQDAAERAAAALERSAAAAERAAQAEARAIALVHQANLIRSNIASALTEAQQDLLEELLPQQQPQPAF